MKPLNGNKPFISLILTLAPAIISTVGAAETHDILLIKPVRSAVFLHQERGDDIAEGWVRAWRQYLEEIGITYSESDEGALQSLSALPQVIIIPNAICLSDGEISRLGAHLKGGGSILSTWAMGSRDERGQWRGYQFLESILGGSVEKSIRKAGEPLSIEMRAGLPGTSNLPPGVRLRMTLSSQPLKIASISSESRAGYWADYLYRDSHPSQIEREVAFVVVNVKTGGRVAWFGSNLDGLHPDADNDEISRKLTGELIGYLSGNGTVAVSHWPKAAPAAALIHGDIEDRFDKVQNIIHLINRLKVPTTFNILTDEAAKYPEILMAMRATGGELGVHGDDHTLFKGQTKDRQVQRLAKALGFIELFGERPKGFRPPELAYDDNTQSALRLLNLKYILTDAYPDRAAPRVNSISVDRRRAADGIVSFPKSELDDYDLIEKFKMKSGDEIFATFNADYNRIMDLGGLYKLNYHSQFLADDYMLSALSLMIERLVNQPIWVATAREIAEWVLVHNAVQIEETSSDSLMDIVITNPTSVPISDAVLEFNPPNKVPYDRLAPLSTSRNCTYDNRNGKLYLYLPILKPGDTFTARIGDRGGLPLNSQSKKLLNTMFIIILIGIGLFFAATIYYLAFTRKRKVALFRRDPLNGLTGLDEKKVEEGQNQVRPRSPHIPEAALVMHSKFHDRPVNELREQIRRHLARDGEINLPPDGAAGIIFIGERSLYFAFTPQGKLVIVPADTPSDEQKSRLLDMNDIKLPQNLALEPTLSKLTHAVRGDSDEMKRAPRPAHAQPLTKVQQLASRQRLRPNITSESKPDGVRPPQRAKSPITTRPVPRGDVRLKPTTPSPRPMPAQSGNRVNVRSAEPSREPLDRPVGGTPPLPAGTPQPAAAREPVKPPRTFAPPPRSKPLPINVRVASGSTRVSAPPPPGIVVQNSDVKSEKQDSQSFFTPGWKDDEHQTIEEGVGFQRSAEPSPAGGGLRTSIHLFNRQDLNSGGKSDDDWR